MAYGIFYFSSLLFCISSVDIKIPSPPTSHIDTPKNNIQSAPDQYNFASTRSLRGITTSTDDLSGWLKLDTSSIWFDSKNLGGTNAWHIESNEDAWGNGDGIEASIESYFSCFQLFCKLKYSHGYLRIFIDDLDHQVAEVCETDNTEKLTLIYTSPELKFGKHKVLLRHIKYPNQGGAITGIQIGYFRIRPYPLYHGNYLPLPSPYTLAGGNSTNLSFTGRRFFLFGKKGSDLGSLKISYSTFSTTIQLGPTSQPNYLLLFQSKELPDKEYTVTLEGGPAEILFFSYTHQPLDGNFVLCSQMAKEGNWTQYGSYNGAMSTNEDQAKAKYDFYGTNFFVYGAKDQYFSKLSIEYGESSPTEINVHSNEQIVNVSLFDSTNLSPQNCQVVMTCVGEGERHSIALFYIYYFDKSTHSLPKEIDTISYTRWKNTTGKWEENNDCLNSYTAGDIITATFRGDRFWLEGTVGPNFGVAEISIDSQLITRVSLFREIKEEHFIYFESPVLSVFDWHTVEIKNVDSTNCPITLSQLIYPNTFINITTYQLAYTGEWKTVIDSNNNANDGSYTSEINATVSYEFFGSRAFFYGNQHDSYGDIIVNLDGKEIATFNAHPATDKPINKGVLYGTDYLPFGKHKIEFVNANTNSNNQMKIQGILIDPLPLSGGHVVSPHEMMQLSSKGWEELTNYPGLRTNSSGSTITIPFFGTRFWLTGTRLLENSAPFTIKIDEKLENLNSTAPYKFSDGCNQILYESEIMELKEHTVIISSTGSGILEICNFFYSTQPKDAILFSLDNIELSSESDWITESNTQISTRVSSAFATANVFCNQLWVFGAIGPEYGSIDVSFNDKLMNVINASNDRIQYESLLYSNSFAFGSYLIKFTNKENAKFGLHYVFYFNRIDAIPQEAASISSLKTSPGWTHSNGKYSCETGGQTINFTYQGTRFFINSSTNCYYGEFLIYLDNIEMTISLYSETLINDTYFASPENTPFGDHIVTIVSKDDRHIEFSDLKYLQYNIGHYINITCMNFTYSPDDEWQKYPMENTNASTCNTPNCSASYTFYGTKVYLQGYRYNLLGEMDIRIDGRFVTQINAYSNSNSRGEKQFLFESDVLGYGQHTINITNRNAKSEPKMEICNIFVCPIPKYGNVLNLYEYYQLLDPKPNNWVKDSSSLRCNTGCEDLTIQFYGTKFWITGTKRNRYYRSFYIRIDQNEKIPFYLGIEVPYNLDAKSSYNFNATLFYESGNLPFGLHSVTLIRNHEEDKKYGEALFYQLFYMTQPPNATIVTADKFQAANCNVTDSSIVMSGAHSYAQFNMYGTNVWIFGPKVTGISIEANRKSLQESVISYKNSLNIQKFNWNGALDFYSIKLQPQEPTDQEIYYVFYLNDQEINTNYPNLLEIGYNSDALSYETWNPLKYEEQEGISTTVNNSVLTITFAGEQFWIEGSYDPSFGHVEISLNHQSIATVSLYREEHYSNQIYYQSSHIQYQEHVLELKNIDGKEISFNKLYVFTPSFRFTLSEYFTNTERFSESTKFTKSSLFSESTKFTKSSLFSVSEEFTKSSLFSVSEEFTISSDFTQSYRFSPSDQLTKSLSFTISDSFSTSFSFSNSYSIDEIRTPESLNGNDNSKGSVPIGLIAGVVVGVLVIILVIILIVIVWRRKNSQQSEDDSIEFTSTVPASLYEQTQDDNIEGPDSLAQSDPFKAAIYEIII